GAADCADGGGGMLPPPRHEPEGQPRREALDRKFRDRVCPVLPHGGPVLAAVVERTRHATLAPSNRAPALPRCGRSCPSFRSPGFSRPVQTPVLPPGRCAR